MKSIKKVVALALIGLLILGIMAGCGKATKPGNATDPGKTSDLEKTQEKDKDKEKEKDKDKDKPSEPIKLKFAAPYNATEESNLSVIQMVKDELNIDLEFVELGKDQYPDKLSINVLSGNSDLDLFYDVIPRLGKFVNAESILPLDDLAKEAGVNLEEKYGTKLVKTNGKPYLLPNTQDIWITLYNKKIFDDAGVAYPTADGWTWSKYIETAKQVTDESKGIYGSSMVMDWDSYKYMYAHQKGAVDFKEDGTSNFDDPLFAEGLQWLRDLSDVHKVQIDMLDYMSKKVAWDHFATGNYAMHINGGWSTVFVNDTETYPRDWEYGILPLPYPDGEEPTSLAIVGGYAIVNGTKNPEAAFIVADFLAANQYKVDPIRQPTTTDISKAELEKYIEDIIKPFMESDGVTVEDHMNAWYNPNIKLINEKVIGPADSYINQLFIDEGELFLIGKQDIETTMKNIKEKADKAISEASND